MSDVLTRDQQRRAEAVTIAASQFTKRLFVASEQKATVSDLIDLAQYILTGDTSQQGTVAARVLVHNIITQPENPDLISRQLSNHLEGTTAHV